MPAIQYAIQEDGQIRRIASGQIVAPDHPGYLQYRANGGAVIYERSDTDQVIAHIKLEADKTWGKELVCEIQQQLALSGINDTPADSLALYRYLAEVRDALAGGMLHVAYAALDEILAQPEARRPSNASVALLRPIYDAIGARIGA